MDIYSHTTETDDVLYEEMKKFEHRNKRKAVSENWAKTEPGFGRVKTTDIEILEVNQFLEYKCS